MGLSPHNRRASAVQVLTVQSVIHLFVFGRFYPSISFKSGNCKLITGMPSFGNPKVFFEDPVTHSLSLFSLSALSRVLPITSGSLMPLAPILNLPPIPRLKLRLYVVFLPLPMIWITNRKILHRELVEIHKHLQNNIALENKV